MPFDEQELGQDAGRAVALFFSIRAALSSMPKGKPITVEAAVRALGAVEDSALVQLAQLIDGAIAQSKT